MRFAHGLLLLALGTTSSAHACAKHKQYPQHFLWGAAMSAHQTEGVYGGGEESNWYPFEHPSPTPSESPKIKNGDNADIAADEWHRYAEDFALAKSFKLNALRTSVAWEKIEPAPGVFSTEAIEHYRAVFSKMRELGITPMIALHHFSNPLWFDERGGWTSPDAPRLFLEYATFVVDQLGPYCDLWITFNEPVGYIAQAYLTGSIPPQMHGLDTAYEAAFEIARAHRMVAEMIHEKQGPSPHGQGANGSLRGVGLANSLAVYDPFDPKNPKDQEAVKVIAELSNWTFIRGLLGNELRFDIPAEVPTGHNFERAYPASDLPLGSHGLALDWVGVNYYTRWLMRYNARSPIRIEWHVPDGPKSDGGGAIYPEGMERILRQAAEAIPGVPLVVTENGIDDSTDRIRPKFIHDHLHFLDRALFGSDLGPALDVRGYFHWTLIDDFEWQGGLGYALGLIEIDRAQGLKRIPRKSAVVFRDEIEARMPTPARTGR